MAEAAGGSGGAGQSLLGQGDAPRQIRRRGKLSCVYPRLSCSQWKGRNLRFLFHRRLPGVAGDVGPFGGAAIRRILEGVCCGLLFFHIKGSHADFVSGGSATLLDASPITLDSVSRRKFLVSAMCKKKNMQRMLVMTEDWAKIASW